MRTELPSPQDTIRQAIASALIGKFGREQALAALSLLVAERDEWHETADNRYDAEVLRKVEGELADCREALLAADVYANWDEARIVPTAEVPTRAAALGALRRALAAALLCDCGGEHWAETCPYAGLADPARAALGDT
jgi:hypothetical protein